MRPPSATSYRNALRAASTAIGRTSIAVAALGIWVGGASWAQELPKTHVTNIGTGPAVPHTYEPEERFWRGYVPEQSNGQITVERRSYDTLGLAPSQMLRLVMSGVVDFVWSDISQVAGDDPVFEGCDLAGLALDIQTARAACEAWKPMIDRSMQETFNVKLLAMGTNPPQVFWCREPIGDLNDLKGRKIRVFNKTMTDFISAIEGTAVTIAFPEVIPALQQGVVDCAVTGTSSGNSAGWPEVTDYIYPLYLGWAINFQAVNMASWERFGPEVQDFFLKGFVLLEEDLWETAELATNEADNCNTNKDPCTLGKKAEMTIVPITDEDKALHKELMESVVLLNWGQRCGNECAAEWNETVGKVVGMQIPLDQL